MVIAHLKLSQLRRALAGCLPCASKDKHRYVMHGIRIRQRVEFTEFTATNGLMLAHVRVLCYQANIDRHEDGGIIEVPNIKLLLSPKGMLSLAALKKEDSNIRLNYDDKTCVITNLSDNSSFTIKFVDGKFPDCDRLISIKGDQMNVKYSSWQSLANIGLGYNELLKETRARMREQFLESLEMETDSEKMKALEVFEERLKTEVRQVQKNHYVSSVIIHDDHEENGTVFKSEVSPTMYIEVIQNGKVGFNPDDLAALHEIIPNLEAASGVRVGRPVQKKYSSALCISTDGICVLLMPRGVE